MEKVLIEQAIKVASFARTLRTVWAGEPWHVVEPFAERAWAQIAAFTNGRPWREVRGFIRESWKHPQ